MCLQLDDVMGRHYPLSLRTEERSRHEPGMNGAASPCSMRRQTCGSCMNFRYWQDQRNASIMDGQFHLDVVQTKAFVEGRRPRRTVIFAALVGRIAFDSDVPCVCCFDKVS
jgi:hypothetical protein